MPAPRQGRAYRIQQRKEENTVTNSARTCFIVLENQHDENGYIPSLVTEGESGHSPLTGKGDSAVPWYWGKTFEEAERTCLRENERLGLTRGDVLEIVFSSMFKR